jgi:hypothetical protein
MVSQPAYLANLKAFSKRRWRDDAEANASANSLLTEESDRGAIILAATSLEDTLEDRIIQQMPALHADEAARKQIFDQDGPISSFSRKLMIAYALGIVDKPSRKTIDLIRELRNACAHSRFPVSLEVPELRAVCEIVIVDMLPDLVDRQPITIRNALLIKIALLTHYVASGEKIEGMSAQIRYWQKLQAEDRTSPGKR